MIGLYIPRDTFIHRLNSWIKFLFLAVCTTMFFMVSSVLILVFFLLFVVLFYKGAQIPFIIVKKQFKSMGFL